MSQKHFVVSLYIPKCFINELYQFLCILRQHSSSYWEIDLGLICAYKEAKANGLLCSISSWLKDSFLPSYSAFKIGFIIELEWVTS